MIFCYRSDISDKNNELLLIHLRVRTYLSKNIVAAGSSAPKGGPCRAHRPILCEYDHYSLSRIITSFLCTRSCHLCFHCSWMYLSFLTSSRESSRPIAKGSLHTSSLTPKPSPFSRSPTLGRGTSKTSRPQAPMLPNPTSKKIRTRNRS